MKYLLSLLYIGSLWACKLLIPDDPLSYIGLTTPYRLIGCNQSDPEQTAFVQAVIYDPVLGEMFSYSPLVINYYQHVLEPPVPFYLPDNSTVGIWFGSNADEIRLINNKGIMNGKCVNGINITVPADTPSGFAQSVSTFGQFAYCNAPEFFRNSYHCMNQTTFFKFDGTMCPTARDFMIIDQDQSDNLHTTYLSLDGGVVIQNTQYHREKYAGLFTILRNPSDEALLTNFIDPALGCDFPTIVDITDEGKSRIPSLPTNEMYAQVNTDSRQALIPLGNPFVMIGNRTSLDKVNLYRLGVFQQLAETELDASTTDYCSNYVYNGLVKIKKYKNEFLAFVSPDDGFDNLFFFLAFRFMNSYDILQCNKFLDKPNPITLKMENDRVVKVEIDIS